MTQLVNEAKNQIRKALLNAAKTEFSREDLPDFTVETPANREHGDFAVNAALVWARELKSAPRAIAEKLTGAADFSGTYIGRYEIAGPGFINFFLSDGFYADTVAEVLSAGDGFGKSDFGEGKRVLGEFVSANPTGPMHIGNARGGAIGDCLAAVLEKAGYEVEREFYVNDAGNQIEKFGKSLSLRYMQICSEAGQAVVAKGLDIEDFCKEIYGEDGNRPEFPMPDDVYLGMDIIAHAKNFYDKFGSDAADKSEEDRRKALVDFALPVNIDGLHRDLEYSSTRTMKMQADI